MDQDTPEESKAGNDNATTADGNDATLIDSNDSVRAGPEGTQKLPRSHPMRQGTDLSGAQLGEYRLVRKIAKGGMGEVYEGVQLALDRRVAVKIIAEELVTDDSFLQRFEREAKSSAALNHPNVAQVYDFGKDGERHFLVLEYVEGVDLSRHVKEHGPLSVADGVSVARQVASALKFALNQSIIHRDIKPANIIWTPEKIAKITDLGLAKKLSEESDVTMTGTGIGSPHYLAPEQADDARTVDHRADIYALGITLLFLLTGRRPFDGESAFAVVLAHANKPLPSSADLGTKLPTNLENLIRRMAAKDPDDRYPDYDVLLKDIASIEADIGPAQESGPNKNPANSTTGILISIVAVALMATAVLFALKTDKAPAPESPATNRSSTPTPIAPPATAQSATAPADHPKPQPGRPPSPNGWPLDERYRPAVLKVLPQVEPVPDKPLLDSDIGSMLKLADDFADKNPEQFTQILARYNQIVIKAKGGPQFDKISGKYNAWSIAFLAAEREEVQNYQAKMEEYNRNRTPHLSIELWKDFPKNLRSEELNLYLADYLLKYIPPNFLWELTYSPVGPGAAQRPGAGQNGRPRFNRPGGPNQGGPGNFNRPDRPKGRPGFRDQGKSAPK